MRRAQRALLHLRGEGARATAKVYSLWLGKLKGRGGRRAARGLAAAGAGRAAGGRAAGGRQLTKAQVSPLK